ncbi:hypothetical protein IJ380_02770, partial [Candidatus Saccharibacteria bacterium]|nr:hypothetical protein [Candidatus Saccharibacteria bacterium]
VDDWTKSRMYSWTTKRLNDGKASRLISYSDALSPDYSDVRGQGYSVPANSSACTHIVSVLVIKKRGQKVKCVIICR